MLRFILLVSLAVSAFAGVPRRASVPLPDGRIVGGEDARIEDVPWQVSLRYSGWGHFCGGSIVKEDVIVSAAHCVSGDDPEELIVVAGTTDINQENVARDVAKIIVHEQYDPSELDYDISVLILKSGFQFSDTIQPIALPEQNEQVEDNAISVISGWGTTAEGGSLPSRLQVVRVPVVNNRVCSAAYSSWGGVTDRMICAGLLNEGGKDACQGDSGGPMVVDGKLVGIVSWGYGCARPKYPGVYSRVASLRDWVKKNSGV